MPSLRRVSGCLGAALLRPDRGATVEFLVPTRWASIETIRAVGGHDLERAAVDPEAATSSPSFDGSVPHYDVLNEVPAAPGPGAPAP